MVKTDVFVLKVLTGMANGAPHTTVKEDKYGMEKVVHVRKVTTIMEVYVCFV